VQEAFFQGRLVEPISVKEVIRLLRELPCPMHVAPSTVYQWMDRGVRGPEGESIRLISINIGGSVRTTRQFLRQFLATLNAELPQEVWWKD